MHVGIPAHEATTRHLGAAYPFAVEPGLGAGGAFIGRDLLGGPFAYDPFELYAHGALTNPNMVVIGQIGRGKSAFVKTYLWRQRVFGRRAWVLDPKGEYGELARAAGVEPIALRPGGTIRLNPLDAPAAPTSSRDDGQKEEVVRRRAELLASLAAASLGRTLLPTERTALELAVADVSAPVCPRRGSGRAQAPTLPLVVEALLEPTEKSARAIHTDVAGLAADGRHVALELRRLVTGDLRGMFDGPTSPGVELDGSFGVLDLSAVYDSPALGVLMTCATAWLQAGILRSADAGSTGFADPANRADPADRTSTFDRTSPADRTSPIDRTKETTRGDGARGVVVVVDEAWAILANLSAARWLQSSWKLARAKGVANVAVVHRLSDLDAAGAAGSEQAGLAHGLLADSETCVVYAQPHGEVERAAGALGLSETEVEIVPHLGRGIALWKVGRRSFLVQHRLSRFERSIVDTDAHMGVDRRVGSRR